MVTEYKIQFVQINIIKIKIVYDRKHWVQLQSVHETINERKIKWLISNKNT